MRVEALRQCDVVFDGPGPEDGRKRALFPGQVYELDGGMAAGLIEIGYLRALDTPPRAGDDVSAGEPGEPDGDGEQTPATSARRRNGGSRGTRQR